jgi:hypothetical protein
MKNSSRFALKIVRKRRRSSSGVRGSVAMASTRRLNSSHERSRLRKRDGSPQSVVAPAVPPEGALAERSVRLPGASDIDRAGVSDRKSSGAWCARCGAPAWSLFRLLIEMLLPA